MINLRMDSRRPLTEVESQALIDNLTDEEDNGIPQENYDSGSKHSD